MLYNLSEFMTKVLEDIGIADLPLPVTKQELTTRFVQSTLKTFSQFYPYIFEVTLDASCMIENRQAFDGSIIMKIPKHVYEHTPIMEVLHIDVSRANSMGDFYYPYANFAAPDSVLEMVAEVQLLSKLAAFSAHAPTFNFLPPDKLQIYAGWSNAGYRCEMACAHDPSLCTIPPTAFTDLFQLAELDTKMYLYGKLKRKENLDLAVGNISLHIDDWSSAAQDLQELLSSWKESSNLSLDRVHFF